VLGSNQRRLSRRFYSPPVLPAPYVTWPARTRYGVPVRVAPRPEYAPATDRQLYPVAVTASLRVPAVARPGYAGPGFPGLGQLPHSVSLATKRVSPGPLGCLAGSRTPAKPGGSGRER
jgi:hypothetical protein